MEHKFPLGSFHRENGTTFSGIPFFPEIFQWNEPKNHVPFTTQPEFPEFFGKWKTPSLSRKTVNARENFWNVYCFATNQMRDETAKDNGQTAEWINHDLTRNNEPRRIFN